MTAAKCSNALVNCLAFEDDELDCFFTVVLKIKPVSVARSVGVFVWIRLLV